jgi:hypothetical protein
MFPYYGTKRSIIELYPIPIHNKIIEPFAGSATYSLKYYEKEVELYDINKTIYDIWNYLIYEANPDRILEYPLVELGESINTDKFKHMTNVEKDLLGFFIRSGSTRPSRTVSRHKNYNKWNERTRKELSENVKKVKHWKIYNMDYNDIIINNKNTYFIDPPYEVGGEYYYNKKINYSNLKDWIYNRKGQIIICENNNSKWIEDLQELKKCYQNGRMNIEMIKHIII